MQTLCRDDTGTTSLTPMAYSGSILSCSELCLALRHTTRQMQDSQHETPSRAASTPAHPTMQ